MAKFPSKLLKMINFDWFLTFLRTPVYRDTYAAIPLTSPPLVARAGQRKREIHPKPKKCCRNMVLFPNAIFLITNFPKKVKISIFLANFHRNFLKISQQFVFFVQTHKKLTHGLLDLLENYAKIIPFLQLSQEMFWKFPKILRLWLRPCLVVLDPPANPGGANDLLTFL